MSSQVEGAILEIRAGTGGEEAELFAADLWRMYWRYCQRQNWPLKIERENRHPAGGLKELIATINGLDVYRQFRREGGVHRVQRIPKTERYGRVHTSAATVAVLPIFPPRALTINDQEIRVDTFRSSGKGGQHVNVTDSAIRLTHLPTGLVVTCQDERSQLKNREKAMGELQRRLTELQRTKIAGKIDQQRQAMVGSGDRSEKIRTYNFPQDRVTDHRINKSFFGLESILDGKIDKILAKTKEEKCG